MDGNTLVWKCMTFARVDDTPTLCTTLMCYYSSIYPNLLLPLAKYHKLFSLLIQILREILLSYLSHILKFLVESLLTILHKCDFRIILSKKY